MRVYTAKNFSHTLKQKCDEVTKRAFEELKTIWRACSAEMVKEIITHVPVDSGMSLASLRPLASVVNSRLVPLSATFNDLLSEGVAKRGHKNAYGRFENNNAKFRSEALGLRLGKQAAATHKYDISFGTPEQPEFNFKFNIVVLQFYLRETGQAWPPGQAAWGFIDLGVTKFKLEWARRIKDSKLVRNITEPLNL